MGREAGERAAAWQALRRGRLFFVNGWKREVKGSEEKALERGRTRQAPMDGETDRTVRIEELWMNSGPSVEIGGRVLEEKSTPQDQ